MTNKKNCYATKFQYVPDCAYCFLNITFCNFAETRPRIVKCMQHATDGLSPSSRSYLSGRLARGTAYQLLGSTYCLIRVSTFTIPVISISPTHSVRLTQILSPRARSFGWSANRASKVPRSIISDGAG